MVNHYKTQNRNNRNKRNSKFNRKNKQSRKHSKKHSRKHNQIGSGNLISSVLQVQYPDIPVLDSLNVDYTQYYKPNQQGILAKEPGILFNQLRNASNSSEILLIMHDPDAPSDFDIDRDREKGITQEWIHWIAVFNSSGKKTRTITTSRNWNTPLYI